MHDRWQPDLHGDSTLRVKIDLVANEEYQDARRRLALQLLHPALCALERALVIGDVSAVSRQQGRRGAPCR